MLIISKLMQDHINRQDGYEALWRAWDEFFTAVNRARGSAAARERGDELTNSQYRLLKEVSERPDAGSGELAKLLGVSAPTTTRMLSGLERDGVVRRVASKRDRRCIEVVLTERGEELLGRKTGAIDARRRALFDSLSPDERAQTQSLLKRLAEAIEAL